MPVIAPVTPESYQALAAFLAAFEGDPDTPETWISRFDFWWDRNPSVRDNDTPRGWIVQDGDRVGGFFGVIPMAFQVLGEEMPALNATTWRVDAAYRNLSMKLMLRAIQAGTRSLLFNTTPNDKVVPMLESLKFRPLHTLTSPGQSRTCGLLPLNPEPFLRSRLPGAFRPLSGPVRPLINMYHGIRLRGLDREKLPVTRLTEAGAEFDDLWQRTRERYRTTAVRSAEAVDWYCFRGDRPDMILLGCRDGGRLRGYAVLWDRSDRNSRKLECVDLWVEENDGDVVQSLVSHTRALAGELAFDVALFPYFSPALGSILGSLGLVGWKLPARKEYYRTDETRAARLPQETSFWADNHGDTSFFP
ncbi:MAG: hypothetical protein HKN20_04575 [Gemmatimonadetes bacterium]|nr:hypothetical protein [Gemmatimonadota bacterium]